MDGKYATTAALLIHAAADAAAAQQPSAEMALTYQAGKHHEKAES